MNIQKIMSDIKFFCYYKTLRKYRKTKKKNGTERITRTEIRKQFFCIFLQAGIPDESHRLSIGAKQWWAPANEILAALTLALINKNFSGASANVNLQKFWRP